MAVVDPTKRTGMPSGYTALLSSNLDRYTTVSPEVTFASIEPHGAVLLCRFMDGEHAEQFELSEAEMDELFATWRRRKRLLKRASAAAFLDLGGFPY